jgi:hypothetical protein
MPSLDNRATEERPSKRQRIAQQPLAREVGLMRIDPGDKFPGFVGSASGIYFIRSVYGAVGRPQPNILDQVNTSASDIVPGEDDHLPPTVPTTSEQLWRDNETVSRSQSTCSFQELVEWGGSYFSNWHPFYPFLHAPTVLEYFETFARNGLPQLDPSHDFHVIVLRSIMSISLADHRQSRTSQNLEYPIEIVFRSYDAAVDSVKHILSKPTTVLGLQAAMSVQLFLVSMLRLNAASRLGGLINRMALQLGLHRCPVRYSSFTVEEKDLRKRVFWSLYAVDRFICQSMGLPLGINDDDVDVCFPNMERHGDSQQSRGTGTILARSSSTMLTM